MKNDKLKDFQHQFLDSVLKNTESSKLLDNIIPGGKLNQSGALEVYKGDYRARLTEALGENFESIWSVLGDEEFFDLCLKYINKNPSQYKSLSFYGGDLPEFLEKNSYAADYPFIIELAEFEKEFWRVFHGNKMSFEFTWENMSEDELLNTSFVFLENIKLYSWKYKIYSLFCYRETGIDDPEFDYNGNQQIILFKNESQVQAKYLSEDEFNFVQELFNGKTIMEIIQTGVAISPESLQELFSFFSDEKLMKPKHLI